MADGSDKFYEDSVSDRGPDGVGAKWNNYDPVQTDMGPANPTKSDDPINQGADAIRAGRK